MQAVKKKTSIRIIKKSTVGLLRRRLSLTFAIPLARMAELVDALDSKSGFRKGVQVRFLFRAQSHLKRWFFYALKKISTNNLFRQ